MKQPYASMSLYVGDLNPDVTETHLFEIFNAIGPVSSVKICREHGTLRSLGYAYVNYTSPVDAERSIDSLNYTPIKGTPCRIMWSQRDSTLRRTGAGNVFVKNLDDVIDNKALHDTFSLFGNILSCKVATDAFGKSKGFGFVHFETSDAAKKAIEKLNNALIGSKPITVCQFVKQSDRFSQLAQNFTNLYVKQFPKTWDEAVLNKLFGKFGTIVSMIVSTDSKSRPFALINFKDSESARKAVETLHGRKVTATGVVEDSKPESEGAETKGDKSTKSADEDEIIISYEPETPEKEGSDTKKSATQNGTSEKLDSKKGSVKQSNASSSPRSKPINKMLSTSLNDVPEDCLYVQRAMSKIERAARLRESYLAYKNGKNKNSGNSLFIKNVHESITDEILKDTFSKFGTVVSAKIMKSESGASRGFGFVSFSNPYDCHKAAVEMNSVPFYGRPLYVCLALSKESRNAQLHNKQRMRNAYNQRNGTPQQMFAAQQNVPMIPNYPFQSSEADIVSGPQLFYGHRPINYNSVPWARRFENPVPNPAAIPDYTVVPGGNNIPHQAIIRPGSQNTRGGPAGLLTRQPNQYNAAQRPQSVQQINQANPAHLQNFKFTAQARNRHDGYIQANPPTNVQPAPQTTVPVTSAQQQQAMLFSDMLPLAAQQQNFETPPQMQKQIIGERLFPLVHKLQPELAGKITGMMLEMDNAQLIALLDSETLLQSKVDEALSVLHRHQTNTSGAQPQNTR